MKTSPAPWALQHSAASDQLKRFLAEKIAHATAVARAEGKQLWPPFQSMLAAAERGDVLEVRRLFEELHKPAPEREQSRATEYCSHGSQWSVAVELYGVLEQFLGCGEKYAVTFGHDVIASIPPGSIYFGGTDPGRFVVTALCESHVRAVPFFTLTQNSLADKSYRQYVRSIYGERILLPSEEDWAKVHSEYLDDYQRRQKENQLRPGELLEEVEGKWVIRGHVSVMALNGKLSKLFFDRNPDRDFYVEESFPMEWMYPHLVPHGLILRINRQPLTELSEEVIQRDHDFWTNYTRPMIGDWLTQDTPLAAVAEFVERAHLKHDLTGFEGDPRFVQNDAPQRLFSKLRASLAGLFAWRVMDGKGSAKSDLMLGAADFAFRQAWALCPRSPEAVFRYINLLATHRRFDDACLLAATGAKLDGDNPQLGYLTAELKKMKAAAMA
jgi:hypothetical protein